MLHQLGLAFFFLVSSLSFSDASAVKYYDLSHTVVEHISKWPTVKALHRKVTKGEKANGIWYQAETIELGTHLGTHLDSPCHFAQGAWGVDDIPFERLVGVPVAVIDIRHKVLENEAIVDRNAEVLTSDIRKWEDRHGRLPEGAVVMILTGFGRFFNDTKMYRGTDTNDPSHHSFPGLSTTAADWLVKFRNIYGVGIDTVSIDYGKGDGHTHEILSKKNIYILENVSPVLEQVPESGATLNVGVMKLGGHASGAPARLVAVVPQGMCQLSSHISSVQSGQSMIVPGTLSLLLVVALNIIA